MPNRLSEILTQKLSEVSRLDARQLKREAESTPATRDFLKAICRSAEGPVKLIAELKRASPSRGLLALHLDLAEVAQVYVANGAAAISVLTDEKFFMGSLATLNELRFKYGIPVPLLRKDFILSPTQVYEARANGADAILLIVAALPDDSELANLHALAADLGLTALVEVHTAGEMDRALRLPGLRLLGINNRDLTTFQVSLSTCEQLVKMVPPNVRVVSESGIFSAGDVERMAQANVDAVLVGEALITAADIGLKVRELSGEPDPKMTHIKICGITNLDDGLKALELGADYLGFNFYPASPRAIEPMRCAEICQTLRQRFPDARLVGVFVNATVETICATLDACQLHLAQLHGDEPLETLAKLDRLAYKAVRGDPGSSYEEYLPYSAAWPSLLLDAKVNGAFGGTGVLGDWTAAREIARQTPIFLAGGLNPENVGQAIEMVRPWGVDTSSGVEERPGKKDPVKMKAFIQAVHYVHR